MVSDLFFSFKYINNDCYSHLCVTIPNSFSYISQKDSQQYPFKSTTDRIISQSVAMQQHILPPKTIGPSVVTPRVSLALHGGGVGLPIEQTILASAIIVKSEIAFLEHLEKS